MPDYSIKALPFLESIARGIFNSQSIRNWMIVGTPVETNYKDSNVLMQEQRMVRWNRRPTKQPFWANYHCGRDSRCTCRIPGSKALESDAIFFFQNNEARILAVHVEFKHPTEKFGVGQPESYPLRAACFVKTHNERPTLNAHHDWMTAIFCGDNSLSDQKLSNFHRIITHKEAASIIDGYPAVQ